MKALNLDDVEMTLNERSFPRQVTMETTMHCNLACVMCPHKDMNRAKGVMAPSLFHRCMDEIAEVDPSTEIWLALHGESLLLGDRLLPLIRYAKKRGLERVLLNTNGLLLNSEMGGSLIDAGVDDVIFGLDGFSREVYEGIRQGADYAQVHDNILRFAELADLANSRPQVTVQFIVMDANEHEEEAFKDYWLSMGLVVKIRRMLNWGGSVADRHGDNNFQYRRIPCPWILNVMHVLWDGTVPRCGGDHEALDPKGNASEVSLYELWHGPMSEDRRLHLDHCFDELPEQCLKCSDWRAGGSELYYP